jgi:formate-dependent phosphoribosylglycinamide formyltransferase (GAR transformylase)
MRKKILLLGSGELGKELVIAFQRLGQYVIAVDAYADAPAMQVAQECEVINMLDGDALDAYSSQASAGYRGAGSGIDSHRAFLRL